MSPQEYGIENDEKLDIGLLTSMPLIQQILADVSQIKEAERAKTKIYFTKGTSILANLYLTDENLIFILCSIASSNQGYQPLPKETNYKRLIILHKSALRSGNGH